MKHSVQDKGTLLLALIAGLSINGAFAALFSSIVPFSVFPILSLLLTVYCLHQRYQNRSMPVGLPGLAAAFFILGCCCTAPSCVRSTRISVLTSSRPFCPSRWSSGSATRCVTAKIPQPSKPPAVKNRQYDIAGFLGLFAGQQDAALHVMGIRELVEQRQPGNVVRLA